ncbi:hypothetical protein TWF481_006563 [Arthrobotrys musiformis]|uniref:NB-ARC domain-containing protein n=1 Tax=Arthrobotrys musiformis TaxID=47236 RepID=A0AAV9W9U7_9PEZI
MPPLHSITVRISGLPLAVSKKQVVAAALSKFKEYISGDQPIKCIKSLVTVDPTNPKKNRVAVLTLDRPLPLLFNGQADEDVLEFNFNGARYNVTVDRHFRGLTCLHDRTGAGVVDLIFVSGLAGHAYGSWKASGKTTMWIEDFLTGEDFNDKFRVLLYGYDSQLAESTSVAGIPDFAGTFLAVIASARKADEAAIYSSDYTGSKDPYYQDVIRSASAAFFFGVPNNGIRVDEWKYMVEGQPNWDFIHDLRLDSSYLSHIRRDFAAFVRQRGPAFRVVTILELRETETVKEVDGVWKRAGERKLMVPRSSALSNVNEAPEDILSRDADHSGIAKFGSSNDPEYIILKTKIKECIQGVCKTIEKKPKKPPRKRAAKKKKASAEPSAGKRYFDVPYPRNHVYVERLEISKSLESLISKKKPDEQIRIAICALGGAGKTQVLLNFAYQNRDTYNIFWLYGSSLDLITSGCESIALSVGLKMEGLKPEDKLHRLKEWLHSDSSGNWLLLVDAVDSLEDALVDNIRKLLPNDRGTVVFTTRNRSVVGKLVHPGYCLDLGERMTNEEALAVLRLEPSAGADAEDLESAMTLLEELGFLPLAIAQAAGYLRKAGLHIPEYLERLRKQDFKLLSQPPADEISGPSPQAVMKTWDISYQYIKGQSSSAAQLLRVLSFFDYHEIPKSYFISDMPDNPLAKIGIADEIDFDDAITWLLSFNLVYTFQSAAGESAFRLHRLVSLWTRHAIIDCLCHDIQKVAVGVIKFRIPGVHSVDTIYDNSKWLTCIPHIDAILKNVTTDPNTVLDFDLSLIKRRYARYFESNFSFASAERLYREVLDAYSLSFGKYHRLTTNIVIAMAPLMLDGSAQARKLILEYLPDSETAGDSKLDGRYRLLYELGCAYCAEKEFIKALKCFNQVLGDRSLASGLSDEDDTFHYFLLSGIGSAYAGLGRFDEALRFCGRAFIGLERKLSTGHGHEEAMTIAAELSDTLRKLGRTREAIENYQRLVTSYTQSLGPTHRLTLHSFDDLGTTYMYQKSYREALKWFEHALKTRQIELPAGDREILENINLIAACYSFLDEELPENLKELLDLEDSLPPIPISNQGGSETAESAEQLGSDTKIQSEGHAQLDLDMLAQYRDIMANHFGAEV